jgi:ABC-type sulfate/molybdate transport systems ATPase subunit
VWVTHDAAQLRRVADRVVRVDRGRFAGTEAP